MVSNDHDNLETTGSAPCHRTMLTFGCNYLYITPYLSHDVVRNLNMFSAVASNMRRTNLYVKLQQQRVSHPASRCGIILLLLFVFLLTHKSPAMTQCKLKFL